ncbi:MAG TPA: acetylxylan esterase [Candidatus Acidoferrales bacterium]|jgi:cephalosporin-C deacetylase-like acetyl esterase|nr:acetylxylan esterase [Candidatus Acidoferrales bacterium]
MTRRELFESAVALGSAAIGAHGQVNLKPVKGPPGKAAPPIQYRQYSRCLPDYLEALAADAYARRSRRVAALRTPGDIRGYQAWARETFIRLAGRLPERTPLNVRTTGAFERERYRVEKLVYESRPGFFVTANLYLPKPGLPAQGSAPFPGVLFQMGHAEDGKGYAPYQRCCQGLVQLGYVVLAFDPMGQGERTYYPQANGWLTRLGSADEEHSFPGRQMLLTGDTATGMQLWDAIRSLDVLASHPQVDPKRLASTGQSGGATLTMMLAAVDDRLVAAAVSSGNTENFAASPFLSPGSTDDAEQDLIGSGPLGFDRWDLLWPMAPKPLLVTTSAHDFFGTYSPSYEQSGREEFRKLARAYATLGVAGALGHAETPLPHGLSYSLRVAVYDWFERHLSRGGGAIARAIEEEPPTNPESDETLWCGATGNTVRDFGGQTPHSITRARASSIQTPERPADLRALLGMEKPSAVPKLEVKSTTAYGDCEILAVEVNSAPKVWAPAWLFLPKHAWTRLLLILEPGGRNARWREDDLYPRLAAHGIAVCAADVRGVGDLEPQFGSGAAGYARGHQKEEDYAWASLILGRSLLGQRTTDIGALAAALAQAYPASVLSLAARDKMTVPALCAAAFEARISKLYLARHLVSWRNLAESETYTQPLANFVPDVLRYADLPEIARSIAPRPVIVAGAVDASGKALPRAQAPYADFRQDSAWDFAALSQL